MTGYLRSIPLGLLLAVAPLMSLAADDNQSQTSAQAGGQQQAPNGNGQQNGAGDGQATADEQQEPSLFERVAQRAKSLSQGDYGEPQFQMPDALTSMTYAQYRGIRFRQQQAIWNDETLFHVELFHPGFLYTQPVTIHTVQDGQMRTVPFDSGMFIYDENVGGLDAVKQAAAGTNANVGFAGFRVHYPINTAQYRDEVIVFLGASYFRMVGRGQNYGISARGLAVNTALPEGEEFPMFRGFWLVKPAPDATTMTIYALLDSPSVSGAYRFDLHPGRETRVDVRSRLFARTDVAKLGVAPLTSMFLYGENRVRHFDDYRPEVHDSDGLLVQTSADEWIWRPLTNPVSLSVTSSQGEKPKGFGLLQRDRDFEHYLDLEARYDRRPSMWVEPHDGDWGNGRVELVEIPSESETNDNIVAYWVSNKPFRAGETRSYDYATFAFGSRLQRQTLAGVQRTRIGWGAVPGMRNPPPTSKRQFIVDFAGDSLNRISEALPVKAELTTSSGTVEDLSVHSLPDGETWRAAFKLNPESEDPIDMSLHLTLRGERLTETWNYVWYPDVIE